MRYIFGERATGKTAGCVEWVRAGIQDMRWPYWNRILITFAEAERRRLIDQCNLNPRQVFTWEDWYYSRGMGRTDVQVMFDNADLILRAIARMHPVAGAVFNKNPDDTVKRLP